jgi:hypothetical protein
MMGFIISTASYDSLNFESFFRSIHFSLGNVLQICAKKHPLKFQVVPQIIYLLFVTRGA